MAAYPMATRLPGAPRDPRLERMDEFTSDLVAARVTISNLARWARRYAVLIPAGVVERGQCCAAGTCALADVTGGREACRLARELAWLTVGGDHGAQRGGGILEDVGLLYTQALRAAGGAVSYCQRVQHQLGDCWFTTPEHPGEALCARTLAAVQLLGSSRRIFA